MTEPLWTTRRRDVINALDRLASISPDNVTDSPTLTDTIHWLVDDTDWDQRAPAEDIVTVLRDPAEAQALSRVLVPLLAVLDELGPTQADTAYLRHERWPDVRSSASAACDLLAGEIRPD
ncbi:MAG TPA: hypothetical protein VHC49_15265 [Mycobacteriales bacterium]|nr:hypothetical protein [Mycobacteriales bacterium]